MFSSPKYPTPPDPAKTAAAQAGVNVDTAQAQQLTNMTNQNTPQGSLNYAKTGEQSFVDSTGKKVTIPQYTATQTYSPSEQKLYDLNNQTMQQVGQVGLDQSKKIGDLLSTPIDLSNSATENRLYDLGAKRLDPRFAQQQQQLSSQLANQGIQAGSEAWKTQMRQLGQDKNDAYNQLLLTGRGQATQEALAERNQPINEISALLGGSQVSQPNFMGTPQSQVGGVDYAGLVNQNYQAQVGQYNAQMSQQNAMMGGLFGLGGAALTAFSDRRVKENISKIGELDNGLPIYKFNYIGGGPQQVGLMAQDVKKVHPEAVGKMGGILTVDYGRAVEN